jgi:hypothetical protein
MPTLEDMTGSMQGKGMCPSRAAEAYKKQHEAAARLGVEHGRSGTGTLTQTQSIPGGWAHVSDGSTKLPISLNSSRVCQLPAKNERVSQDKGDRQRMCRCFREEDLHWGGGSVETLRQKVHGLHRNTSSRPTPSPPAQTLLQPRTSVVTLADGLR